MLLCNQLHEPWSAPVTACCLCFKTTEDSVTNHLLHDAPSWLPHLVGVDTGFAGEVRMPVPHLGVITTTLHNLADTGMLHLPSL